MNLIFAKLFEEYLKKENSPNRRITMYISIVYFFLTFVILLPLKTYIDKKVFLNNLSYYKTTVIIFVFGLFSIITFIVHKWYIKSKFIYNLVDKYKERKLNKIVLYIIVTLIPVALLLLPGLLTVLINGGSILGHRVAGLAE